MFMSGGGDNGFATETSARTIKNPMVPVVPNINAPKRTTAEIKAMLKAIIERIDKEEMKSNQSPDEETLYTRMALRSLINNPNLAFEQLQVTEG